MAKYMFFKELKCTASLKKQIEYADQLGIPQHLRLGQGQDRRESCTDILGVINRPVKAGDELIVYNLFIAGINYSRMYEVLQAFHKAQIQLHIIDADYFDRIQIGLPLRSESSDYRNVSSFLRVLINENKRQNQIRVQTPEKTSAPGRPRKDWASVPKFVREIVIRHDANLYSYSISKALNDISQTGYYISEPIFKRLLKEYRTQIKGKSGR